jgi:hypothetical protein
LTRQAIQHALSASARPPLVRDIYASKYATHLSTIARNPSTLSARAMRHIQQATVQSVGQDGMPEFRQPPEYVTAFRYRCIRTHVRIHVISTHYARHAMR